MLAQPSDASSSLITIPDGNYFLRRGDDKDSDPDSDGESVATTTVSVPGMATSTTMMTMTTMVTETKLTNRFGTSPTSSISSSLHMPPPTAAPQRPGKNYDGISSTTQHLLIAAGSIGATLVLVFLVAVFLRMRRGYSFGGLLRSKKDRSSYQPYVSAPMGSRWSGGNGYPRDIKDKWSNEPSRNPSLQWMPSRPNPAAVQPDTSSSNRSLMSAMQQQPVRDVVPSAALTTPALSKTIPRKPPPSAAPSSPVLPIERGSREFASETMTSHTSMPPYLQNIASGSQPKVSRFSWTNSQAPKTPMDTRFSVATSTSSFARYRTVESWVGAQAGRLDDARMQEHLRHEIEKQVQDPVPSVPRMPSMDALSAFPRPPGTATPVASTAIAMPIQTPNPILAPIASSALNRTQPQVPTVPEETTWTSESLTTPVPRNATSTPPVQAKHRTQGSDATVFRAHPGTKIDIPVNSRIPSEVLDNKIIPAGAL